MANYLPNPDNITLHGGELFFQKIGGIRPHSLGYVDVFTREAEVETLEIPAQTKGADGYKIPAGELKKLVEEAAAAGAARALESLGLGDPGAREDLKEAIGLARAWREARSTVAKTILQAITLGMIGALAVGAALGIVKQIP